MGFLSKLFVAAGGAATAIAGSSDAKLLKNYEQGRQRENKAEIVRTVRREQWSNRGGKKEQRPQ